MTRRLAYLAAAVLVLVALGGCARGTAATTHPAATTVARLLDLRSAGSTDVAAYEPFFAEASLAAQLAESADGTTPAVPGWSAPYVSKLTSTGADVVVRWEKDAARFPAWPSASVFVLDRSDGRWVVVDVADPTGAVPRPLGDSQIAAVADKTVDK